MDGVLLFDKPLGWTSHDAVDFIRRIARQRQVGHAGTLDPMATGLLVLLLGKATKLSLNLSGAVKGYDGSLRLGVTTDTYDLEGKTLSTASAAAVTADILRDAFKEWVGEREQVPPMFSAVKQGGKKLYELARQGVSVDVKPRAIVIERFDLVRFESPEAYFSLTCSKGTYVRSLCDAIGKKLGCGAILSSLVRTQSGDFFLKNAANEEELKKTGIQGLAAKIIPYENLSRA
jgi:tRNA pseudouridine55 synthase